MNVEKRIESFKEKFNKSLSNRNESGEIEPVKVIKLTKKHFKKELSTNIGFGFQDLKKKPKQLISKLVCDGYNLNFTPVSGEGMSVLVTVKPIVKS